MKIRNHYNYDHSEQYYAVNSGEILTVHDESYTIEEILEKFTRGINLGITQEGYYSDSEDFNDVDESTYIKDLSDLPEAEQRMEARRKKRLPKADIKDVKPPNGGSEAEDVKEA